MSQFQQLSFLNFTPNSYLLTNIPFIYKIQKTSKTVWKYMNKSSSAWSLDGVARNPSQSHSEESPRAS